MKSNRIVIVLSNSEELFTYITTENGEFVTIPGRVVTESSQSHIQGRKSVLNEFTLKCQF